MAGKNGKNGGVTGTDQEEDKAIPTPEAPTAVVTAAAEPPKANPTPEGEDTYTSQQLFGQKTYDQQMRVEEKFAGLNRTDEISQLGGASKLEVDLAQMKIFSTERVGDDVYAAILRGDVERVEAMVGLNSDRRLTEAQLLVLIKAKHEQDEELGKKLAQDAYFAQELEGKKKHAEEEEVFEQGADNRNQQLASGGSSGVSNQGYIEPDNSLMGYDEYNNYHDAYGGYSDPAGTYHDPFGGELDADNIYTAADGDIVDVEAGIHYDAQSGETVVSGTDGEPDVHIAPITQTTAGEPVTAEDNSIAVETAIVDHAHDTAPSAAPAPGADPGVDTTRTAPAAASADGGAMRAPAAIARPAEGDSLGQASAAMAMNGREPRGAIGIGASNTATHISEESQRLVDTKVNLGNNTSSLTLWRQARRDAAEQAREEMHRYRADHNSPQYKEAERKLAWSQNRSSDSYIDFLRDTARDPNSSLTAEQRAAFTSTADQLTHDLPVIRGRTRALADERERAAHQSVPIPASDASSDTSAPSPVTAAIDTTALKTEEQGFTGYDEQGFYHDENGGYYDNDGGYFDKDGGYRDSDGTYYAADGGIFDTKGGYEWPDGSYEDAHGNYVDANGVLYAVDGTVLRPEDHPTEGRWGNDFKRMLKDAAEKDPTVNPFDPATGPSAAKTDAFINSKPSWASKTEEERAEWRASRDITSSYFKSDGYLEVASLPVWDPSTGLYSDDTLNPLKPGAPTVMMA